MSMTSTESRTTSIIFTVGDFQTVMGYGTIGTSSEVYQFARFVVFKIGQQIHFLCFCHYLW